MNWQIRDVVIVNVDSTFRRMFDTHNHIEGRRFTGTIGPEQTDNTPLVNVDTDLIYHVAVFIRFDEIVRLDIHYFPCSSLPGINTTVDRPLDWTELSARCTSTSLPES